METVLSRTDDFAVAVADPSHVGSVRATAQRMARALDFDETRTGRVGIVVTEAVTNMLKHANGGTFAVRTLARGQALGMEMLAIDSGPGMADVAASSRDGVSSLGTQGTGLGSMRRQSDEFEIYSYPGGGTVVRMQVWNRAPDGARPTHEVGAVCIPKDGETVCGDGWAVEFHERGASRLVADGLGHGPEASRAAATAVEVLKRNPDYPAIRLLDNAHGRLRPTRGAAVAVIRHDLVAGEATFAGVGNISAVVLDGTTRRAMVSHSGIVGHNVHKSQEYRYAWPRGAMMLAHTDGLETQWSVDAFPGLLAQHASVIAAVLYRRHSRKRDDCTVVVAKALG
jgi:anti-sigma regulatory factor (Ser/Thr protein kinase)